MGKKPKPSSKIAAKQLNYFDGKRLSADDLQAEQSYLLSKVRILDSDNSDQPNGQKSNQAYSDNCIYTIVNLKALKEAAKRGGEQQFSEKKPWVTGYTLWQKAKASGEKMPVIFADAASCRDLLYWGLLTKMQASDAGTTYTVDQVRKLKGKYTPQDLVLKSTGKNIAPDFRRPYAICMTPSFL